MHEFIDGSTASLRATGVLRYFGAGFLGIWLIAWAIGEAVALAFLFFLVRSAAGSLVGISWPIPGNTQIAAGLVGYVFLFLIVWLSLWTVGGYAAINEFLRNLAGEDRVSVAQAGVELVRRAGPFSRARRFARSQIRRVRLRGYDNAVVIDTQSSCEVVTSYGTPAERQALANWLQRQLSLPHAGADPVAAPPGWTMTVEEGTACLNRMDPQSRRVGMLVTWLITALTALMWGGSLTSPGATASSSAIALALTLVMATWAAWVTWSRREWRVRQGELTAYSRFALWQWERTFKSARLEIVVSTDSDNDRRYELKVIDEQGKKTIASEIKDDIGIIDLGKWMAARTGFPLKK